MLKISANDAQLTVVACGPITSDRIDLPCEITLSKEFDGLAVTVVFKAGDVQRDVAMLGSPVHVPAECLEQAGEVLMVGIWAGDGSGRPTIPTVWASAGTIRTGALPSGYDPDEPEPDWAAQVQQYAQDAHDTAERLAEEVDGWETEIDAAVQGAETAAAAARAAASSASSAATSATNAASAASTAAGQASTAAGAATDAASEATGAAASATAAAADATEAAGLADNATAAANAAASNAETATREAITATTGANTAAATANAATGNANAATTDANDAAASANAAAEDATAAAAAARDAVSANLRFSIDIVEIGGERRMVLIDAGEESEG